MSGLVRRRLLKIHVSQSTLSAFEGNANAARGQSRPSRPSRRIAASDSRRVISLRGKRLSQLPTECSTRHRLGHGTFESRISVREGCRCRDHSRKDDRSGAHPRAEKRSPINNPHEEERRTAADAAVRAQQVDVVTRVAPASRGWRACRERHFRSVIRTLRNLSTHPAHSSFQGTPRCHPPLIGICFFSVAVECQAH